MADHDIGPRHREHHAHPDELAEKEIAKLAETRNSAPRMPTPPSPPPPRPAPPPAPATFLGAEPTQLGAQPITFGDVPPTPQLAIVPKPEKKKLEPLQGSGVSLPDADEPTARGRGFYLWVGMLVLAILIVIAVLATR